MPVVPRRKPVERRDPGVPHPASGNGPDHAGRLPISTVEGPGTAEGPSATGGTTMSRRRTVRVRRPHLRRPRTVTAHTATAHTATARTAAARTLAGAAVLALLGPPSPAAPPGTCCRRGPAAGV
ncbi:hypothetical protein GCM10010389_10180 [Streptomyces echinoruber]|uniref:Uncharacterized protein n=2 Tax=Streptomyces echinoruber TaxID=68898 RepID=A0A918QVW6_9ACTN|nr:hypothetical protein GCM10010389_10180 [Streptomyces echinoruber]